MSTEQDFLILDAIDRHKPSSQRELARFSGMSLGKTNYVLKRLVDEGFVKTESCKESTKKSRYLYLLTPKGILTKSLLTVTLAKDRMREFEEFRNLMLKNLKRLQAEGVSRVLVCAPDNVGKFIAHIARRENLNVQAIGTVADPENFDSFERDSYDCILIADDPERFSGLLETSHIPSAQIKYLE